MGATGIGVAIGGKMLLGMLGDSEAGKAEKAELGFYANQAIRNSKMRMLQAADARWRGDETAVAHGRQVSRLEGAQRAGAAAQGILVDAGSTGEIADETARLAAEDLNRIRVSAAREAAGLEFEAGELMKTAQNYKAKAKSVGRKTLLTSLMRLPQAYAEGKSYGL